MDDNAPSSQDYETLSRRLQEAESVLTETAVLCDEQKATIQQLREEIEFYKKRLFGRRSERLKESPGQGHLFDETETADETDSDTDDTAEPETEEITYTRRKQRSGWGKIPEHLPRKEIIVDVPQEQRICSDCGEPLEKIGEDRSERVDYIPARVIVKVFVRPKYGCPKKHGIRQQESPVSPVPGGRYDFGLVAQVLTNRFADHLPYYRQQDTLSRSGLELSRSTLCRISGHGAFLLEPLASLMKRRLLDSGYVGVDDTPVRLLDPDHPEGVRQGRFWLYRGLTPDAAYNVFDFRESRSRDGPIEFLKGFSGWVTVDAYGVNDGVYIGSEGRIKASCCWAHARRKFHDAKTSHPSLAAHALGLIGQLYEIDDRGKQLSVQERLLLRESESKQVLESIQSWLLEQQSIALPKSKLGEAIRYTQNQWTELSSFLTDGRLPIDNNDVERDLRRLTIGRKNWMFIGSKTAGSTAATIYSVIASASRHHLDIWAYLNAVMQHLAKADIELEQLLPENWAKTHPSQIRQFRTREKENAANRKREKRQRRNALKKAMKKV